MPEGSSEPLGQRVRRIRQASGLSQTQLAQRMGITQARVSQIERGSDSGPLRPRTLRGLADALGVDLGALIAGDPTYEDVDPEEIGLTVSPLLIPLRPVAPFIGRDAELAAVTAALRAEDQPLLTLVGPAGVGKTQLALHAAAAVRSGFAEQVVVSLAPCFDMASVLTTIARGIGLQEWDERPLRQRLVTALADRHLLLLLDNVEQVLPAVSALVAEIVTTCANLRLLLTSRAPLNIRAERVIVVPPLGLPEPDAVVSIATAAAAPAVQMFVHRASVSVPGFALTEANAASIAAICRRLDGLPLAVELAAPRTRVLTPDQLLRQLERRLGLLTAGARDLPPRQRSLRASIAWSFDLLPAEHQALFRRVGVFSGGFTLEAAIEVATGNRRRPAAAPATISRLSADVVTGLASLLDQNLLVRVGQPDGETPPSGRGGDSPPGRETPPPTGGGSGGGRPGGGNGGEVRFDMLETIQEFAREQLEASGEAPEIGSRHLEWCQTLAEAAATRMFTAEEHAWLARLHQEDANLQAALAWAFGPGRDTDLEAGLRLAGALADYWFLRGLLSEGRAWLTQAVHLGARRAPSIGQARSLVAAALIEQTQGAIGPAESHAQQCLAMARRFDDQHSAGRALLLLGNLAIMRGDLERARSLHEEALAGFRAMGDESWTALALLNLGLDAYRHNDFDRAASCAEDALRLAQRVGDRWDTLYSRYLLADIARSRGDLAEARALFVDCLRLSRRYQSERDMADALGGLGTVAVAAGDMVRAAGLCGAAESLYRRLEIALPPPLRPEWDATVAAIRAALPPDQLAKAWTVTPDEIVRETLGLRQD